MHEPRRFDIDGLRAVAVLAVIVFHANPALIPGGFVGVDVFFVISGYLITSQIAAELSGGRFSLLEFYRRRIKRIAPAMLVVTAVSVAVGYAVMLPEDITDLAKSAVWSVASLANVYFWRETSADYFAPDSHTLPLLHLWSLGVEEQFYVLWPICLMVIWRWRGRVRKHAAALALALAVASVVVSCVLAEWMHGRDAMFVYYMLPTRAGELGLGAALALLPMRHRTLLRASAGAIQALAGAGAVLLILSFALLSEEGPFPGWRALPPTLGTGLLLWAGTSRHHNLLTKLLSCAPAQWLGAVSYSAYLWHWPVMAFWRYAQPELGPLAQTTTVCMTLLLAWGSYRWVELPARESRANFARVFGLQYAIPASVVVCIGLVLVFGPRNGLQWEDAAYREALAALRDRGMPAYRYPWMCQRQRLAEEDLQNPACVLAADQAEAPRVLLLGDSNAAHYVQMLRIVAEKEGFSFRNVAIGSCPPVVGDPRMLVAADRYADCVASLALVKTALRLYPDLILAANWTAYQQRSVEMSSLLESTLRTLTGAGHRVLLLGKAPEITGFDRLCQEKALKLSWMDCGLAPQGLSTQVEATNALLKALAQRVPGATFFDPNTFLCPSGVCPVFAPGGESLFYDAGHLSVFGSTELRRRINARQEGLPAALLALRRSPGP